MNVRVVTDSTADIPAEWAARLNILVVPTILNLAGRSVHDGVDITRAEYYRLLPALHPLPTTAAPASGEFEQYYRQCAGAEIVSLHVAEKLSAVCNSARLGAEASGQPVTVIDSEQLSLGLGWQALAAAEAAAAGKPLAEVITAAASTRRRVRVFAALDTIEYLRRSGRASAFAATFGNLLQIKPMLELARGEVRPLPRQRTRHKAIEALAALVEDLGPLERLAVLHVSGEAEARGLAERLAPRAAQPPLVVEITTVVGTHLGPGALGAAAVCAA